MKKLSYLKIIKIIKKKKIKKIFTFGQSRGGTTISSYILAHDLGFLNYFVPEEISNNLNIKRMFIELVKNKKIFIHHHHNVFKRQVLNNKDTVFIYIYRHHNQIIKSFEKTKKRNISFDWVSDIEKRVLKRKKVKNPVKYLNDLWKIQSKYFYHSYVLDYESLKNHKLFINQRERDKKFKSIKQIFIKKNFKIKDNFNLKRFKDEKGFDYLKMVLIYYYYKAKLFFE
jgi:hypothetical protein